MAQSRGINIGLTDQQRADIASGLSSLLADSYTLYLMTHSLHWNVTGPMFNTLHLMFMQQYTEQWNALDLIAERIRALGFPCARDLQLIRQTRFDSGGAGRAEGDGDGGTPRCGPGGDGPHRPRPVPDR